MAICLKKHEVTYATTEFAANIPDADKNKYVKDLISQGKNINFIQFTNGTVIPKNTESPGGEHMYSFDYAYKLSSVRDWLFKQHKN